MNVIHTHIYIYNYGKSPFLRGKTPFFIGKTSIFMVHGFHSELLRYQRVLLD